MVPCWTDSKGSIVHMVPWTDRFPPRRSQAKAAAYVHRHAFVPSSLSTGRFAYQVTQYT